MTDIGPNGSVSHGPLHVPVTIVRAAQQAPMQPAGWRDFRSELERSGESEILTASRSSFWDHAAAANGNTGAWTIPTTTLMQSEMSEDTNTVVPLHTLLELGNMLDTTIHTTALQETGPSSLDFAHAEPGSPAVHDSLELHSSAFANHLFI